ncbi:MAG: FecR domain-containing protein [Akkermansiaceae bacterium]|jgi:hypothetical protein|nr:FecR domain-containing protein [Akkermansiaceae bacterium]
MNDSDEILARWLEGELSDEESAAWKRKLERDPELRKRAITQARLHGMLGVAMEDEFTTARRTGEWLEKCREIEREEFVGSVLGRVKRRQQGRFAAAAAVIFAIGLACWVSLRPDEIGRVVRMETVEWRGQAPQDFELEAGSRFQFLRGLVELELGGRGRMIVEGPADLEILGPLKSRLHEGRVTMRVEESGHGYQLETPRGKVVDLGTEFGVSVGEHRVETHVLEGAVEAYPAGGEKLLLGKDDAVRFEERSVERIDADLGSFYTLLPPQRAGLMRSVHWPLETEGRDGSDAPEVRGYSASDWEMVPGAHEPGSRPVPVEGVFGKAMAFDGRGGYMASRFPGIGGDDPRTVCFWVKVPDDFRESEGFGIVSWGNFQVPDHGSVWQISVNPLAEDGPVGRIRVGVHGGQIVGQTDLRDGRWHHVAVVLYPASRADIGKHVLVYLDGQLEALSRRSLLALNTRTDEGNHGVWIARNVTHDPQSPHPLHGGFFRGAVDELSIFDAALSPEEIRSLMEINELPR